MTSTLHKHLLYFITPTISNANKLTGTTLLQLVDDAIRGGVDIVQWRQKPRTASDALPPQDLLAIATQMRAMAQQFNIPFIVNDSIDLALQLHADGVHIGQSDDAIQSIQSRLAQQHMDQFMIGVTVRNGPQAKAACENGAAYLGVGPVFSSSTKPEANDGKTIEIEGLKECCDVAQQYNVPVYAIGGVGLEDNRIEKCIRDGHAHGVAVIAAISEATNHREAAQAIRLAIVDATA